LLKGRSLNWISVPTTLNQRSNKKKKIRRWIGVVISGTYFNEGTVSCGIGGLSCFTQTASLNLSNC
jgi:hypothetical protein